MVVEVEEIGTEKKEFPSDMIFEQEPGQIAEALVPLFLSSQILRAI
jgi:F-type H+-transporting ATPase subunit gamma